MTTQKSAKKPEGPGNFEWSNGQESAFSVTPLYLDLIRVSTSIKIPIIITHGYRQSLFVCFDRIELQIAHLLETSRFFRLYRWFLNTRSHVVSKLVSLFCIIYHNNLEWFRGLWTVRPFFLECKKSYKQNKSLHNFRTHPTVCYINVKFFLLPFLSFLWYENLIFNIEARSEIFDDWSKLVFLNIFLDIPVLFAFKCQWIL